MKLILNSQDSFVAFGKSGSATVLDDTAKLFPLVQSASISTSFSEARQKSKNLGTKGHSINDFIKQPSVNVSIDYLLSPYCPNEVACGMVGVFENSGQSLLSSQRSYHSNIYLFFNNAQNQEGFEELRFVSSGDYDDYTIIGVGNCYLSSYSLQFSIGSPVKVSSSFVGENMLAASPVDNTIPCPSINLINGAPATSVLDLDNFYTGLHNGNEGRSSLNPSATKPYECSFALSELQGCGINLASISNPIIQSISLGVDFERNAYYSLGSNYPYTRKATAPLNGSFNIDFLVSGIKEGDLDTLVSSETGHSISLTCLDAKDNNVSISYSIPSGKLENASYSCDLFGRYKCQMQFSFEDIFLSWSDA